MASKRTRRDLDRKKRSTNMHEAAHPYLMGFHLPVPAEITLPETTLLDGLDPFPEDDADDHFQSNLQEETNSPHSTSANDMQPAEADPGTISSLDNLPTFNNSSDAHLHSAVTRLLYGTNFHSSSNSITSEDAHVDPFDAYSLGDWSCQGQDFLEKSNQQSDGAPPLNTTKQTAAFIEAATPSVAKALPVLSRHFDFLDAKIPDHSPIEFPANASCFHQQFSPSERLLLRLYDLADFAEANLYLIDEVINIIKEEISNGFDFKSHKIPTRDTFFENMKQRFPVPEPIITPVALETQKEQDIHYQRESRDTAHVIHYDFLDLASHHLSDHEVYGDIRNLRGCIDETNPFGNKGTNADNTIDEIEDGQAFKRINQYIKAEVMPKSQFPDEPFVTIPVTLYLDEASPDKLGRNGIEPCIIQFHRLNRTARNQPRTNQVLMFIPNFHQKSKAAKKRASSGKRGKGQSVRNKHKCISAGLKSFLDAQGFHRRVVGWVRYGDKIQLKRVFFPLLKVLGDGKSQLQICGVYAGNKANHPSRACLVGRKQLSDYNHTCQWRIFSDVEEDIMDCLKCMNLVELLNHEEHKQYNEEELTSHLKALSIHPHNNAFTPAIMCRHPMGIFGATPTDPMHAFLHGVLDYAIEVYLGWYTPKEKSIVDRLVDRIFVTQRQSTRKTFPRVDFTNGITNLTQITAEEWLGVAFTMLISLMTTSGAKVHDHMEKRTFENVKSVSNIKNFYQTNLCTTTNKDDVHPDDEHNLGDRIQYKCDRKITVWILEKCLTFYAWYRHGAPYKDWYPEREDNLDAIQVGEGMATKTKQISQTSQPGSTNRPSKVTRNAVDCNTSGEDDSSSTNSSTDQSPANESSNDGSCESSSSSEQSETTSHKSKSSENISSESSNSDNSQRQEPLACLRDKALFEIRKLQCMIVNFLPRKDGHHWDVPKLHELLHVIRDMSEYSSPMNFDCGIFESFLKVFATKPGRMVRRSNRRDRLKYANQRLVETSVLQKAFRHIDAKGRVHSIDHIHGDVMGEKREDMSVESTRVSEFVGMPYYTINLAIRNKIVEILAPHVPNKHAVQIHPLIISWFHEALITGQNVDSECPNFDGIDMPINCYTEYVHGDDTGFQVKYRAHPHHNKSPWHDWVMIEFPEYEIEVNERSSLFYGSCYYPCKILTFFEHPRTKELFALVHCASRALENEYAGLSQLCEVWEMEYRQDKSPNKVDQWGRNTLVSTFVRCVHVDNFSCPVFVIEENPGFQEEISLQKTKRTGVEVQALHNETKKALLIRPFDKWQDYFISDNKSDEESNTDPEDKE